MTTTYLCQIEGDELIEIRAESAEQAARRYLRGGDWSAQEGGWPGYGTLQVMVWRDGERGHTSPEFIDVEVENWGRRAEDRLDELDLPSSLLTDESGQTSEIEHLTWIATAPADEITRWADDMARDAE